MDRFMRMQSRHCAGLIALALLAVLPRPGPVRAAEPAAAPVAVEALIAEALAANPEIRAARHAHDAAERHAASARALEDPTLELGVVNEPLPLSMRRDDMTMKMLGLAQKLPYPGKRALRESVAAANAASVGHAVDETANRVARDLRLAYEDLRFADAAEQLAGESRELLRQLVAVSAAQYRLGHGAQSDVLRAQAEVGRMQQELLRIAAQQWRGRPTSSACSVGPSLAPRSCRPRRCCCSCRRRLRRSAGRPWTSGRNCARWTHSSRRPSARSSWRAVSTTPISSCGSATASATGRSAARPGMT